MATDRYTIRADFEDNATKGMDVLDKAMAALDISGGKLSTGIGVLRAEIANLEKEISSGKGWDELSSRIRNTLDEIQEFGGSLDDQRAALKAIETQALRTGEPVALVANAARKLADEADSGAAASQHLALAMDLASAAMLKTEDAGAALGRVVRGDVAGAFAALGPSMSKAASEIDKIADPAKRAEVGLKLLNDRLKNGPPIADRLAGSIAQVNAGFAAAGLPMLTVERAVGMVTAAIGAATAATIKFVKTGLTAWINDTRVAKEEVDRLAESTNHLSVSVGKTIDSMVGAKDATSQMRIAVDEMSSAIDTHGTSALAALAVGSGAVAMSFGGAVGAAGSLINIVLRLSGVINDALRGWRVLTKAMGGSSTPSFDVAQEDARRGRGIISTASSQAQADRVEFQERAIGKGMGAAGDARQAMINAAQNAIENPERGGGGGGGGGGGRIGELSPGFGGQGLAFGLTGELLATTAAQFITDLETRWADAQARQFSAITASRIATGAGFQAIREDASGDELAGALGRVRDRRADLAGAIKERKALGMETGDLEAEMKRLEGVQSSLELATGNARQLEGALEAVGAQVLPQLTSSFIDFAAAVADGSASIKDLGKFAAGTLGDILINQSKQLAQFAILNAGVFEWIGASYATLATNPAGLVVAAGGLLAAGLLLKAFAGSAGGAGGATGRADSQAGAELERMGRSLFDRERSRTGDTYVLQVGDRDMRATVRDMTQDGLDRGQISLTRARAMG